MPLLPTRFLDSTNFPQAGFCDEEAFLSRDLARLRTDAPVNLELEQLRYQGPSKDKLRELFTELGFTQLLKSLETEQPN